MRHLLSKKEIIIDLTSLLDVIFIVLMVVMFGQNMQEQSAQAADNNDEITTVEALKEHYEKYEYLDEYVLFIDIYSDIGEDTDSFLKDRDHRRSLYCTKGIGDGLEIVKWEEADGSMTEHIDITDATEEAVLGTDGKLYSKICSFIDGAVMNGEDPRAGSETGNVIVILSVNRDEDKILFRDEYKIGRLLDDIAKKYADQNITIAVR